MGDADPRQVLDAVNGLEDLADWVADVEPDSDGLPVLLRQYLGLGGRVAAFNVDPKFSNVMDALILVDMAAIPAAKQAKYMGKAGAIRYQAVHAAAPNPDQRAG